MSDSRATFTAKANAMIAAAQARVDEIAREYISDLAAELIVTTPGPNLQKPDTEYIATGRLRGGWSFSLTRIADADRWDGGPYTEHGDDTLAAIEGALAEVRVLPSIVYVQNDVAYGHLVAQGLGRHADWPRPWVWEASKKAPQILAAIQGRP